MKTVIGSFLDRVAVEDTVDDLRDGGFMPKEISQIAPVFDEVLGSASLSHKEILQYKMQIKRGVTLVTVAVETAGEYDEVMTIMDDYGAEDIHVVDHKTSATHFIKAVDSTYTEDKVASNDEHIGIVAQAINVAIIGVKGGRRSLKKTVKMHASK